MEIEYSELKDEMQVMVYIPACKHFYNATVIETVDKDFTIAFVKPIKGHYDVIKRISSQEGLDRWFFVCKRQKMNNNLLKMGDDKFQKNGTEWFFN